jgi:hypothetical protein
MATATLSRFTVKLPTNQSASTQGMLMPKLQYRFRVTFNGFGVSSDSVELTKQVVSFSRPTVSFGDIDLHVYNSIVKLAGKPSWENVTVVVRDDASGLVSRLVGEQLQKQFDFFEQSSAASGIDYKFQLKCEMLDGGNGTYEPQILETWELAGCYVQQANYQEVNYNNNDPVTVQMTIRFDNAVQTPGGTGIGTNIGRALGVVATG